MMFGLGFCAGVLWCYGGCVTAGVIGWTGPFPVILAVWPILVGIEAVDWMRDRYRS